MMGSARSPATTPVKTKVLIVDDHPIVRERLSELIDQEPDLTVCGEAEDAAEALAKVESLEPGIAVVDITLKDTSGIELIKQLKQRFPKLPVLVLSMHDESLYAERALRAGARGYITKQEATRKVLIAIRRVLDGEVYVSQRTAETIVQRVAGVRPSGAISPAERLTDREFQIFQLIGQGHRTGEIAQQLKLSVKTVEAHRAHIKTKLEIKSSAALLRYAIEMSLHQA